LVDDEDKVKGLVKLLSAQKEFCFDTETTGLEIGSELVAISFSIEAQEAYFVIFPENQNKTKARIIEQNNSAE
jgi:DNA polymerase-1